MHEETGFLRRRDLERDIFNRGIKEGGMNNEKKDYSTYDCVGCRQYG
jgi:hypothetical protein